MSSTAVPTRQIRDGTVRRVDLDTTTGGAAVIAKAVAGTGISLSSSGVDSGTGDVTISVDLTAIFPLVDTTTIVKGSSDATKKLRFEVDGLTTGTTRTVTIQDYNGTMALWEAPNVFTTVQEINTGSNMTSLVDGLVLANDTVSDLTHTTHNTPAVVFEAHGWNPVGGSGFGGDEVAELYEVLSSSMHRFTGGFGGKLSWLWSDNGGTATEKSYIDSAGNVAGNGYFGANIFAAIDNIATGTIQAIFSNSGLSFTSATAVIINTNTTAPLIFNTFNSTVSSYQFLGRPTTTTSATLVEIFSQNTFTGKYLDIGVSGTSKFSVDSNGVATSPAVVTGAISCSNVDIPFF